MSTGLPTPYSHVLGQRAVGNLRTRVAGISYLEARPLTDSLGDNPDMAVTHHTPASVLQRLVWDQADVGLIPTIDLQCGDEPLVILPAGCIATAGPSFTTRVFSRVRPEKVRLLWADADARTTTALARLLWAHNYRADLEVIPFHPQTQAAPSDAEAVLVVGDRVVTDPPLGYDWQLDLGALWWEMTGLPMVYSVWAAREDSDYRAIYPMLAEARKRGQRRLDEIARELGPDLGWPVDLAVRHLTRNLQFDCGRACVEGIEEFFDRADELGLLGEHRPLHFFTP